MSSLESIKKLKEWGVEVYFDEENMSSLDPKNEAMFTIMSSMAQEESRHISENVKWTFHKKIKEGWDFTSTSRFLGYDRDPETKQLVINEEEAKVVRLIFDLYCAGVGPAEICRKLEAKGYKTGAGKTKWMQSTIQGIIKNEKYKGDLLLQKTVTLSYLDHKRIDNDGHATKYYIENSHPPIVSREQWNEAQEVCAQRRSLKEGINKDPSKYNARYPMSARLICMQCGAPYKRRQWMNGGDGYRFMYQCTHYITPVLQERCKSKPVSEKVLMLAACEVINKVFMQKDAVFPQILKLINDKLGSKDLTEEINQKLIEREGIDKQITFYLNQKANSRDQNEIYYLNGKYQGALAHLRELDEELQKMEKEQMETENVQNRLKKINELLNLNEIVPEMLTNDIMDAFIYKILIVDKRNAIFCINTTKSMSLEEFIEKRKEFLYSEPILDGMVKHEGTQRLDFLNYKVVTF
ncbi:MAG: recombinase family protein [Bacteroidales bacterium]